MCTVGELAAKPIVWRLGRIIPRGGKANTRLDGSGVESLG